MSEIRNRVEILGDIRSVIVGWAEDGKGHLATLEDCAEQLLSIPELAIVDREAILPDIRWERDCPAATVADVTQHDMVNAGWVKEVKE